MRYKQFCLGIWVLSGLMFWATSVPAEPDIQWAIALHGGAGSSPQDDSEAQQAARRQSLKQALSVGVEILSAGAAAWMRSKRWYA